MPYYPLTEVDKQIKNAIEDASECYKVCLETATYWYLSGEELRDIDVWLILDCSDICNTTSNFLLRDSEFIPSICEFCADVCDKTAENLELLAVGSDKEINRCIEACTKCAISCREAAQIEV